MARDELGRVGGDKGEGEKQGDGVILCFTPTLVLSRPRDKLGIFDKGEENCNGFSTIKRILHAIGPT